MIIPITLDISPSLWCENFPIISPVDVKKKDIMQNNTDAKVTDVVILFNPIPTLKLSILTEKAYKIILNIFKSYSLFFLANKSTNISIKINKNIIPNNLSSLKYIILLILFPKIFPKSGIIKWNIPTIEEKRNIFFLLILNVPKLKDNENVSMDKANAINNNNDTFIINYILKIFIYNFFNI